MAALTQDRLKELVSYDEESGEFRWNAKRPHCRPGDLAGYRRSDGYLMIGVDFAIHYGHRLAWLYMTGEWPTDEIDHINGDPRDCRFANLRPAAHRQNIRNQKKSTKNTSGFKGVSARKGRWRAVIRANYRQIELGLFASKEDAHAAYLAAAKKYFGEFARAE